jgi:KipI family sensor histidine kinase inhibitor
VIDSTCESPPILIRPAGESAAWVRFGDPLSSTVDADLNRRVHALAQALGADPLPGLGEAVAGYAALVVQYDPLACSFAQVEAHVRAALRKTEAAAVRPTRTVEIAVVYGGEDGPDLAFVAQHCGLSEAEVVRIHSGGAYPVYMMGFAPGFPYLGGMDVRIAAPRLETPRSQVPAGSVGIAGQQTGIYPLATPGGWRIIGQTSARLFDPLGEPPFLLSPGDVVRFSAVEAGAA